MPKVRCTVYVQPDDLGARLRYIEQRYAVSTRDPSRLRRLARWYLRRFPRRIVA